MNPNISIITASYNAAKYLQKCIDSVAQQTFPYREHLIADGSSQDGTLEIIKNNADKLSWWVSEPDRGIYHAWNKALQHAKGEWVLFLGADDYFWNENVLGNYVPYLNQAANSGIRIVYGKIARMDQKGNIIQYWGKPWDKISWQMKHGMPLGLPHTGLMHHASLFKDHGLFDDEFRLAGDYEFLLRELKYSNRKALFIESLTTVVQRTGGTADANNYRFHQEVAKARRKNGLPKFSWLWWLVHLRSYLRYVRKPDKR